MNFVLLKSMELHLSKSTLLCMGLYIRLYTKLPFVKQQYFWGNANVENCFLLKK